MHTVPEVPYLDGEVTPAQVEAGFWCRPEALARTLGIDERTIRRRVRAGRLWRHELGGRVYVRQPPPVAPVSATEADEQDGQPMSGALALVVREQLAHLERLALELGQARATVEQLERVRQVEQSAQAAHVAHLEHELGTVRQLARAIGEQAQREQARATATEEQLAQARAQVEHERQRTAAFVAQLEHERTAEQARAARLEQLARAPWYAVRVRRRLRRELGTGTSG